MRQKRGTLRNPVIAHASLHAGPLAPEDDDDRLYLQIELMNDRAITLSFPISLDGDPPAVTLWVDATWGFRHQGAANDLTHAHQAFAAQGYKVVSVEPYIENGDLQGFFVTYQKP